MSEKEKDILFEIDMQLYNEFNDKICEINEHLGDIYTYKDLDDILITEKNKEIELLRKAIEEQQKEIEDLKEKEKNLLIQLKDSEKELLEVTQNISKDKEELLEGE